MNGIKFKNIEGIKNIKINFKRFNKEKSSNYHRDFNFFEPYVGIRNKKKIKYLYISVIASALTFIFITTFVWNYIQINNTKHEIETMKKVVDSSQTKDKLKEIDKLKKKYDVLNKYYGQAYVIATAIDNKNIIDSTLIQKVFLQVPKTVSFKSFNVTCGDKGVGGTIDIQGIAENRANIAELEHNLKLVESIKSVQVSNITEVNNVLENKLNVNLTNNSSYTFSIKCILKDVDENEAK